MFLLVDILGHATEPVEEAMTEAKAGEAAWSHFAGLALVYALGFGVGLPGPLYASRLWKPRPRASIGPGAMAAAKTTAASPPRRARSRWRCCSSSGSPLHNATEGFGIVGPLAAADVRPSWGWLRLAGLIGAARPS